MPFCTQFVSIRGIGAWHLPHPKATLSICGLVIATSIWFPFCHHMLLATWSIPFWKCLVKPIPGTFCGMWNRNHIL
jgi:hypothetical protein